MVNGIKKPPAPSSRAATVPRWRGRFGIALLIVVAILVSQYLAGTVLLAWVRQNPRLATPLTLVRYAYYYGRYPQIRTRLVLFEAVGISLVAAAAGVALLPRRRSLHGDARFARRFEIARAGLFSEEGVILGALRSKVLVLPGQQSIILAAPPRSGKGVGVVIPNALNWSGSLVAIDIKRENWTVSAGYRAACGQATFRFEPLAEDGETARWNCLSYVSADPQQRINDIQRIADLLYAEAPGADPFWVASARSLFLGICLYLFETPSKPATIGEIRRQGMASDDEGFGTHWKRVVEGRQSGDTPLSAECVRALYDVIDLAPVTASSVRKTFTSRLDLWANPLLDNATSSDDFDLRNLRKIPMSIYVAVNPDDLHRLRPVLSLFFQQCLGLQTRELPEHNLALKYPLLMLLDEFTALGRIPIISESIAFLAGYNVRVLMVIQATSQLREVYGAQAAETMLKSVAVRIVFAPKDYSDAKEISDDLGVTTVKVRSVSRPGLSLAQRSRGSNVSIAEHARPLLLPQEVKELGNETAIIFLEGTRPIRAQKIRYYADRRFQARLLPPPQLPGPNWRKRVPGVADATSDQSRSSTRRHRPSAARAGVPDKQKRAPSILDQWDGVTLDQFGERVSTLQFVHAAERPTDQEMADDVTVFLGAMR